MTAKDRAKLARLERENARLREELVKAFAAYRNVLMDVVDLRGRLDAVKDAVAENDQGKRTQTA